jgi:hypothetical protein
MSESALESAARLHAARRGVRSAKLQGGVVGEPDRVFFLPGGRCWLVEFKTLAGRLSPRQQVVIHEYRKLGHLVNVVRSMDDFRVWLDLKLQAVVDCRLTTTQD